MTEEDIETMRRCAKAGQSYSDAAKLLGVTRNVVAGKASRLGIKFKSGKTAHGSKNPTAKLHEADIPHIRRCLREGFSKSAIAAAFEVSRRTIRNIEDGTAWAHVRHNRKKVS